MFAFLEAPKIFFWESTRIGFVEYPLWLDAIYVSKIARLGIRLFISLLTFGCQLNRISLLKGWAAHKETHGYPWVSKISTIL